MRTGAPANGSKSPNSRMNSRVASPSPAREPMLMSEMPRTVNGRWRTRMVGKTCDTIHANE
jgi:hypothetical protein